jgi:hypothetical protein
MYLYNSNGDVDDERVSHRAKRLRDPIPNKASKWKADCVTQIRKPMTRIFSVRGNRGGEKAFKPRSITISSIGGPS